MGHQPFSIHRIASETAPELVMDAAGGHVVARVQDHACRFRISKSKRVTKQKLGLAGLRKFGRPAKASMPGIVALLEGESCMTQGFLREGCGISLVTCNGRLL